MEYAINRIRCQVLSVSSILPALNDFAALSASTKLTLQVLLLIPLLLEKFSNNEFIDDKFNAKFFLELEMQLLIIFLTLALIHIAIPVCTNKD